MKLADKIVAFVEGAMGDFVEAHMRKGRLPEVFGGHRLTDDTRVDFAYVLSLLHTNDHIEWLVDPTPVHDIVSEALRGIDGKKISSFSSYRIAEALKNMSLRHSPLWDEMETAMDVSDVAAEALGGGMPANYLAVAARGMEASGWVQVDDGEGYEDLKWRVTQAIALRFYSGWVDDGKGQYDIYTPDMLLFTEPIQDQIDGWREAVTRVLDDLDDLALPGGAVVWGRSTGALSLAMTIELAGLASKYEDPSEALWMAKARDALQQLDFNSWFGEDGVIKAHQHRSTMEYRPPARRLQMTFDILGKLLIASEMMEEATEPVLDAYPDVDRFVEMSGSAGVWAHRGALSFVLPVMGGRGPLYASTPRAPGLFEATVNGPSTMVPVIHSRDGDSLPIGGGVKVTRKAQNGRLMIEYGDSTRLFEVEGRTLKVTESLELSKDVEVVSLTVPVLPGRPLKVVIVSEEPAHSRTVNVDGIPEWRTPWSQIYEIIETTFNVKNLPRLSFTWMVTPILRVARTVEHPYDEAIYGGLDHVFSEVVNSLEYTDYSKFDVVHMHWPEAAVGYDIPHNEKIIRRIKEAGCKILWTQHNLVPHDRKGREGRQLYALWARSADAVIHHTKWGKDQAQTEYIYGPKTIHRVITHGHWAHRVEEHSVNRRDMEVELGLEPCAIRYGVVGAPRDEKNLQLVLDAFHKSKRADIQLFTVSRKNELVPYDDRITVIDAGPCPPSTYYRRIQVIDAFIFPFLPTGMLMTGVAYDAMALGKAVIITPWPALQEVFGDAALEYDGSREALTKLFDETSSGTIQLQGDNVGRLCAHTGWDTVRTYTEVLLEDLMTER